MAGMAKPHKTVIDGVVYRSVAALEIALNRSARSIRRLERHGALPPPQRDLTKRLGGRWYSDQELARFRQVAEDTDFYYNPQRLPEFRAAVAAAFGRGNSVSDAKPRPADPELPDWQAEAVDRLPRQWRHLDRESPEWVAPGNVRPRASPVARSAPSLYTN
jgi:hypothetical protein